MFEPKIVKNKEEIEKFKCDNWTYSYDGEYTNIFSGDDQKVITLHAKLDIEQVKLFKFGFELAFTMGKDYGRAEKADEIKKLLKI